MSRHKEEQFSKFSLSLVIDNLFYKLTTLYTKSNCERKGININGGNLWNLLFADDMTLIAKNKDELIRNDEGFRK